MKSSYHSYLPNHLSYINQIQFIQSRRARARASNFYIAQNYILNKGEHVLGHFEQSKISRPYLSARALCARAQRT